MPVETRKNSVVGKKDYEIVNITEMVSKEIKNSKISNLTITVFCIVSIGAITTMEYEPNLSKDVSEILDN
jgi:thiamine phosphate synthase YjbQ (UPF0047 family)